MDGDAASRLVVLLGLDDTDSVQGGCTTHTAWEFVRSLEGVDLIGLPRLVRLNPNVPYKTRGNGAVALRLGHGRGERFVAGRDGDQEIWAFEDGEDLAAQESEQVFKALQRLVGGAARMDDPKTNPGVVLSPEAPRSELYRSAVRRIISAGEAVDALGRVGARFAGWKNGRGVIGAAAACAWPAEAGTYEWIAYREPQAWGTPRDLPPELGPELDRRFPSTFDNHDPATGHLRIAPSSPCPVLAGIRGTDRDELGQAAEALCAEAAAGGLLFATNQATDDHLAPASAGHVRPFTSPLLDLTVVREPYATRGGHLFIRAADRTGPIDLAAFEPTGAFREPVRALRPGDRVLAMGSVHADPTMVSLEKLETIEGDSPSAFLATRCPACGSGTHSRGVGEDRRCNACGNRCRPPTALVATGRRGGRFEVPPRVRRHLSRPYRLEALAVMGAGRQTI